jgi:hypothetical protein
MYLYVGRVKVGPLSRYLWLLGNRLYLKLGWRPSDTYFLGNLSDPPHPSRQAQKADAASSGREEGGCYVGKSVGGYAVCDQALQGQPPVEGPQVGG